MLLIGSRALALRAPHAIRRKPVDFDFMCFRPELERWLETDMMKVDVSSTEWVSGKKFLVRGSPNCEFEVAGDSNPSTQAVIDAVIRDPETIETSFGLVPSLDMLFLLKTSHRHLKDSPFFWKTMSDWFMLRALGASIRPEHEALLRLREKETYAYRHPSLERDKKGFFNGDGVTYVYDHDDIHRAVALFDVSAYTRFQRDGAQVAVDREKFVALPKEQQLASAVEEAAVLAIERSLVPFPGKKTPDEAWRFAFSKVCTSITSGWWRTFAYENALDVIKLYRQRCVGPSYWETFESAVRQGRVRKHDA